MYDYSRIYSEYIHHAPGGILYDKAVYSPFLMDDRCKQIKSFVPADSISSALQSMAKRVGRKHITKRTDPAIFKGSKGGEYPSKSTTSLQKQNGSIDYAVADNLSSSLVLYLMIHI